MNTLENKTQINGETCIHKVLAMRNSYIDDMHEHCKNNCESDFYKLCHSYKPVSRCEIPLNYVRLKQ